MCDHPTQPALSAPQRRARGCTPAPQETLGFSEDPAAPRAAHQQLRVHCHRLCSSSTPPFPSFPFQNEGLSLWRSPSPTAKAAEPKGLCFRWGQEPLQPLHGFFFSQPPAESSWLLLYPHHSPSSPLQAHSTASRCKAQHIPAWTPLLGWPLLHSCSP